MQKRRNAYIPETNGSLALDERRYPAYEQRQHEHREVREEGARRVVSHKKPLNKKRMLAVVFVVMVVFAGLFMLGFRQTKVESNVMQLHKLRTRLQEEQKRADNLHLELSLKMNISEVQTMAQETLGMDYPDAARTERLTLPPLKTGATMQAAMAEQSDAQTEQVPDIEGRAVPESSHATGVAQDKGVFDFIDDMSGNWNP